MYGHFSIFLAAWEVNLADRRLGPGAAGAAGACDRIHRRASHFRVKSIRTFGRNTFSRYGFSRARLSHPAAPRVLDLRMRRGLWPLRN